MRNKILLTVFFIAATFISGCQENEVKRIDTMNDDGKEVLDLDYRDFELAAAEMTRSMIASGAFNKQGGGRYVVATSNIDNITSRRIDTDQLMAKIEEELYSSGQVVMTSAVGGRSSVDKMVHDIRDVRDSQYSDEFKSETLVEKEQLIAPELSISGKIFQNSLRYDKDHVQQEYYFQLKVTELASGLRKWQKEVLIGKRGKITEVDLD
ncbi:MAG: penicillin-binding protein activator LpoB [Phycisphaerae bacterium]|jgi:hypothetical protein